MNHEPAIRSAYFGCAFHPEKVQKFISGAKQLLKDYQFDTIAFSGMSGAVLAPILAYSLNKSLIMVRKRKVLNEEYHSHMLVEGDVNAGRYLILDDFRCSGATIRYILEEVHNFAPEARCIGAVFYHYFLTSASGKLKVESTPEMYNIKDSSIFSDLPSPFITSASVPWAKLDVDCEPIEVEPSGDPVPDIAEFAEDVPF